jgi:cyclophilin family peptidyl-prolyl cis-trans isomerase
MTPSAPLCRALAGLLLGTVIAACSATPSPIPSTSTCPSAAPTSAEATAINAAAARAVVATNLGSFTIQLDAKAAPIATANFVALARCGFYDGISFHRVIAGFIAQAGDPQSRANHGAFKGLGSGGPGYLFNVEFPSPDHAYDRYIVAMANSVQYNQATGQIQGGTDTNGSQFFIDLQSLVGQLPPYYTIFGRVVVGTDVIDAIGAVKTSGPSDGALPGGVPLQPVIISSITIESGS